MFYGHPTSTANAATQTPTGQSTNLEQFNTPNHPYCLPHFPQFAFPGIYGPQGRLPQARLGHPQASPLTPVPAESFQLPAINYPITTGMHHETFAAHFDETAKGQFYLQPETATHPIQQYSTAKVIQNQEGAWRASNVNFQPPQQSEVNLTTECAEKTPLVPADSRQASEIQRPFPPRKSSLPTHAKPVAALAASAEATPNTGIPFMPATKESFHLNVTDNTDRSKNGFENAAPKSRIWTRSTAFTGGVDKKFLNHPWRQPTGPSPTSKGFLTGLTKSRPSQSPVSASKADQGSSVNAATAKKSLAPTSASEAPLCGKPGREIRLPAPVPEYKNMIPQLSYNAVPLAQSSTANITFMTNEEQVAIMERYQAHLALQPQQQSAMARQTMETGEPFTPATTSTPAYGCLRWNVPSTMPMRAAPAVAPSIIMAGLPQQVSSDLEHMEHGSYSEISTISKNEDVSEEVTKEDDWDFVSEASYDY